MWVYAWCFGIGCICVVSVANEMGWACGAYG